LKHSFKLHQPKGKTGFLLRKTVILVGSTFIPLLTPKIRHMTNPNDDKSYREVQHESYTDKNGNTHTDVTRTSETVNNNKVDSQSYESGYVKGQTSERNYQEGTLVERDNENAGRGLLIGMLLTALAGLIGGSLWYFNQRDRAVDNTTVAPIVVPAPINSPSPTVTVTSQPQTTIIERTKEVAVPVRVEKTKEVPVFIPVPQQKAAPAPTPATPNINITVPAQQTPAKQTQATPPKPLSSPAPTTSQTDNSKSTPSVEKQNTTDVTPDSNSPTTENNNQNNSAQ
jgi:hypothetical protein